MRRKMLNLGLIGGLLIILASMGGCAPAGGETGGETSIWTMLIFLALIFGLMYFVMIRPQRKRQKQHQEMVEELRKGDRVVTAGGIYGQIETVSDDSVVIKIESGVTMRVAKGSVALKQER